MSALGTMTWGPSAQVTLDAAIAQIEAFVARVRPCILDTARIYQFGETEELIGTILAKRPDLGDLVEIHTKAHPLLTKFDDLGIETQLDQSLKALGRKSVHVFYLHQPDSCRTPLLETLKACDRQYRLGKFQELGLSNFAAWEVAYAHSLCLQNNLVPPTVYQGVMNGLTRSLENELMPMARTLGLKVFVFNPLAGGFLTGRYQNMEQLDSLKTGRFSDEFDFVPKSQADHPMKGKGHLAYRQRYWHSDFFEAIRVLKQVSEDKHGIPLAQASIRWCTHHSTLKPSLGDRIIFGASKLDHVISNLDACTQPAPLPDDVVEAFAKACANCVQEGYFRGYDREAGKASEYLSKF